MNVHDFAALTDNADVTVRKACREGRLKAVKDGTRGYIIDTNDPTARAWIAKAEAKREKTRTAQAEARMHDEQRASAEREPILNDKISMLERENLELRAQAETAKAEAAAWRQAYQLLVQTTGTIPAKKVERRHSPASSTNQKQADRDADTLAGWRTWQQEHENPRIVDYARAIGRPRTTVTAQIKRAEQVTDSNE